MDFCAPAVLVLHYNSVTWPIKNSLTSHSTRFGEEPFEAVWFKLTTTMRKQTKRLAIGQTRCYRDLDLWTHHLENIISSSKFKFWFKSLQRFRSHWVAKISMAVLDWPWHLTPWPRKPEELVSSTIDFCVSFDAENPSLRNRVTQNRCWRTDRQTTRKHDALCLL